MLTLIIYLGISFHCDTLWPGLWQPKTRGADKRRWSFYLQLRINGLATKDLRFDEKLCNDRFRFPSVMVSIIEVWRFEDEVVKRQSLAIEVQGRNPGMMWRRAKED